MKISMRLALLALAAINVAVVAETPAEEEKWHWLGCGRGKGDFCGEIEAIQVKASSRHEVRCCSDTQVGPSWVKSSGCSNYAESDLKNPNNLDDPAECFHNSTFAEAEAICDANGANICTKEQVEMGCSKGSGCSHDYDLVWTSEEAPPPPPNPAQEPRNEDDWLWLSCGSGTASDCVTGFDVPAQAKEGHEVRCCSKSPKEGWMKSKDSCSNWHETDDLKDSEGTRKCFHNSTYAEAQAICDENDGYVCTKQEVESGCVKGSGCQHDYDLVWTSDDAPPGPELPEVIAIPDEDYMFLACGSGTSGRCKDGAALGVAKANEKHEVRCCSGIPHPGGWMKGSGCSTYHESDLLNTERTSVQCFHNSTYAEAQAICAANQAYVCTREEAMSGCVKGSGCSHDSDLIWTSNRAGPAEVASFLARQTQAAEIAGVCTGAKGRVWGDPHFITFDDLKYDCQGNGEFVIAMSKGDDPLAIHGRFVQRRQSSAKPTVTESLAIQVSNEVPIIHVTVPEQKVNGRCPFSFSIGKDEVALDTSIVEYFQVEEYDGKVNVFMNNKNVIFTFPEQNARVQVTAGGSNRCVINTNVCLTPEKHGGATNIVGLLGSPNGNKNDDWMNRDETLRDLPANKSALKKEGHQWCMDNWCIGHADNSLWSPATHALYNQCNDKSSDPFFDNLEDPDPAIVQACESTENPDECVTDTIADVLEGGDLEEVVDCIKSDDEEDKLVDNLGEGNAEESLEGWNGPVLSSASAITIELPEEFIPEDPANFGGGNPNTLPTDPPVPDLPDVPDTDLPDPPDTGNESDRSDTAGSLGDPHFKSWKGEHFEYHGQCDMVLTKDNGFADGLGLEVQIRTKLVRFWSYIENAAIHIGDDILEVQGSTDAADQTEAIYWYNLEYQGKMTHVGGFPITVKISKSKSHKRTFEIDLSSKYPGQKIIISTFHEFVRVDFVNASAQAFGKSTGMLGDFKTGNTLARDGKTVMNDFHEFGNEWQVLPTEHMLFHSVSDPQFPKRCILPEDPRGDRRRRLEEETISAEEAEAACAKTLSDPLDVKDCVYDILATQNLDIVGAF